MRKRFVTKGKVSKAPKSLQGVLYQCTGTLRLQGRFHKPKPLDRRRRSRSRGKGNLLPFSCRKQSFANQSDSDRKANRHAGSLQGTERRHTLFEVSAGQGFSFQLVLSDYESDSQRSGIHRRYGEPQGRDYQLQDERVCQSTERTAYRCCRPP